MRVRIIFVTINILLVNGVLCVDEICFNRPILSVNCFYCHGQDDNQRQAGLRLDVREDAIDGGAIKPGLVYGSTDEFGWSITENPAHVHDMQPTIMHLCGIDHARLTYRDQGRQYRLTDVHGEVVNGIIA